mmetsp:Transcript_18627/g.47206  ORF Transcript_18627/g.47206 Transcript_18627/m.47206 type:complete len:953 (-) Transcript_18627:187-3045(-)|eukprot:CAMPEP_0202863902 /NCGR_PEP_ID=MMETSP1391-20130828/4351_1 /ASSEMBLY_ACC=CAM_ASM_000867 /TAXON_ID=1034604 /ORGANISM="Chlamydomonas leiostraca, Strain SAG 11-49" /LENGTH=952 /DNA_ID=CAMNT_0049543585 /DNA_START=98 /DNA_END=2956 /DNA_ORIENTATION=+
MDPAEEQARKAERIKALLAGYYGQGEAGQQGGVAPPGGSSGKGSDNNLAQQSQYAAMPSMDSPAFDAQQHIAQMLKTSSLERLMVEHRNTAKEIKNLDSDMQQLVYENYNKFISATDTIRAMKGHVDTALPELDKLKAIMDNVADKSTSVSTKLQTRQDKMEELYRIQMLLKKLQAVFDLPKRMRAALEEDVLDTAVSFYAESQPLLKKYGSRGAFRQIAIDSDQVAKEISQVLKRRLAERKDDTERCVLLLRKLGEPDDTLQDRYLAGRAARLRRVLKDATAVADAMAAAAATACGVPGASEASASVAAATARASLETPTAWGFSEGTSSTGALTVVVAPGLRAFIKSLDERLINAINETVINVMRFFLPQDLPPEAIAAKRKPLIALAREAFADYFRIVRRVIADSSAAAVWRAARLGEAMQGADRQLSLSSDALIFGEDWGTDQLAGALATLSADLGIVAGGIPQLSLKDSAAQLVQGAVAHHVQAAFGALRSRVLGSVEAVRTAAAEQAAALAAGQGNMGEASNVLRRGYAYGVQVMDRGLEALMAGLRAYEGHPRLLSPWHAEFLDVVQGGLQSLYLLLLSGFLDVSGVRYDGSDLLREALKRSPSGAVGGVSSGRAGSSGGAVEGLEEGADKATLWATSPQLSSLTSKSDPATASSVAAGAGGPGAKAGASAEQAKSGMTLMLAKLCLHMEQSSVPWVMEHIAGAFMLRGAAGAVSSGRADLPPAFVPGEVARRLSAASSALLGAYVEGHGRQLSLMVRRSVAATSWLHHKEPRGPRPVCDLLAERLGRAEAEVGQLVDDAGRARADTLGAATAAKNERGFDAGLLLETGNVERNLAKIFREKVKVFGGPVQFTQSAILGAIAGIGLKSLVECIRLQTLGRAGLQQLQLDCHYLRPLLRRYTGGRGQQVVESLLDEVVSAGVERSTDPTLLEPAVLDRILNSMDNN